MPPQIPIHHRRPHPTLSVWKSRAEEISVLWKEVTQDDDFTIHVTCADSTKKLKKIDIAKGRKSCDPMTAQDITEMRSLAGSMAGSCHHCRQCRPDLSYPVSQMMSSVSEGSVADLRAANRAAELSGPVTLD